MLNNDDGAEKRWLRFLAKVAAFALLIVLVLWVTWQIRSILPPFLAAFLVAVALAPVVDKLEARGLPRWLAVVLVYLVVLGAIGGLVFILVPIVSNQIGQVVADLRGRFRLDQPADISRTMTEQIRILGRRHEIPAFILQPIVREAKNSASLLTRGLEMFGRLLISLLPNIIWLVLVPVIGFYALIDYHRIFAKALLLFTRQRREDVRGIAFDVSEVFGKYLRGLLLVCFLDTVATIAVLMMFPPTRPYAAALGLIAGVLYAVPYLGAIISTSLVALVAFAAAPQHAGPGGSLTWMMWVTFAMVVLHQVVFDQIISPRVLGGQVGLHPILSIFALMAGGALFGIGGMLLAVPAAASLQVVIVHILPRLARKVEVQVQRDVPPPPPDQEVEEQAEKTVTVKAGQGVTGTPILPAAAENPADNGTGPHGG